MKEFNIKITDNGEIYINGELKNYDCLLDETNQDIDLDKKAILSLVEKMGYEAPFFFEEINDRLNEMIDEIDEEMFWYDKQTEKMELTS